VPPYRFATLRILSPTRVGECTTTPPYRVELEEYLYAMLYYDSAPAWCSARLIVYSISHARGGVYDYSSISRPTGGVFVRLY